MEAPRRAEQSTTKAGLPHRCCPRPMAAFAVTEAAVARCKALADRTRLTILATLAASDAPICVCDLNAHVALEQPTVSHHLKVLRAAGLIEAERRGTWVYYRLRPDAAVWVRATLSGLPR